MKFAQFCQSLANHAGKPSTFLIAVVLIATWAASGPWFHYNCGFHAIRTLSPR